MNKPIKIGLTALALVAAPLAVGAVLAQGSGGSSTGTTRYADVFLDKLAAALGLSKDKLQAGLQSAGLATIDQALQNQDITRTQADALRSRVTQGEALWQGLGSHGRFGADGRGRGNHAALLDAAAKTLGLSSTELHDQLESGKGLSEIAKSKNVSLETVNKALLDALKAQLDLEVKAGRRTQAQADADLKRAEANPSGLLGVDDRARGGFGGRGDHGGFEARGHHR